MATHDTLEMNLSGILADPADYPISGKIHRVKRAQ